MLIVAAFAMWNMGVAFLVGVILDNSLRREWIRQPFSDSYWSFLIAQMLSG